MMEIKKQTRTSVTFELFRHQFVEQKNKSGKFEIPGKNQLLIDCYCRCEVEHENCKGLFVLIFQENSTSLSHFQMSTSTQSPAAPSNDDSSSGNAVPQQSGTIVGESIPMAMVCGIIAGVIFGIFCLILHVCLVRCLVKARAKHIPKVRKVKVKKDKKGKKGGKKGKKGKKSGELGTGDLGFLEDSYKRPGSYET